MAWTDAVEAIGGITTPIAVLGVGYWLDRRLRAIDSAEWKHQELVKARVEIFRELSPLANDLMCYLTFVGRWAKFSPPEIIEKKRDVDRLFFAAEPLFSEQVRTAYDEFMNVSFATFGNWGQDARIRSGCGRRKEAWPLGEWKPAWDSMFLLANGEEVSPEDQLAVRSACATLLAALADDIKITPPRVSYGSTRVSSSAY